MFIQWLFSVSFINIRQVVSEIFCQQSITWCQCVFYFEGAKRKWLLCVPVTWHRSTDPVFTPRAAVLVWMSRAPHNMQDPESLSAPWIRPTTPEPTEVRQRSSTSSPSEPTNFWLSPSEPSECSGSGTTHWFCSCTANSRGSGTRRTCCWSTSAWATSWSLSPGSTSPSPRASRAAGCGAARRARGTASATACSVSPEISKKWWFMKKLPHSEH